MTQVWLAPNRLALLWSMALLSLPVWLGLALLILDWQLLGWVLLCLGLLPIITLAWGLRQPCVGYRPGEVLFYLRVGAPIAVPLEVVECFLLGQGPTLRPGESHRKEQTKTVVVRLAEKALDWTKREVNPRMASWCEGYITIRGTFCEPLSVELVQQLNRRLSEAKREQAQHVGSRQAEAQQDQVQRDQAQQANTA